MTAFDVRALIYERTNTASTSAKSTKKIEISTMKLIFQYSLYSNAAFV